MSEEEFGRKEMRSKERQKIQTDNNISIYGQTTDFDFQR